jgi:hypothetical protein
VFESLKAKTAMLAGAALLVTSLAATIAPAYAGGDDGRYDHHKKTISQNQDQDSFGNTVYSADFKNESEIEDNAFRHASGVVQVNQATGVGNQNDNMGYVDGDRPANLRDNLAQDAGFNTVSDHNGLYLQDGVIWLLSLDGEAANESSIEDNAFRHATGLVQINQAAGNLNENGNEAVITDADLASSKVRLHQGLFVNGVCSDTTNSATIEDNAFRHFTGVAQINQASGDLNQNKNQLSVAR